METKTLLKFCIFISTNRETVDIPIILRLSSFNLCEPELLVLFSHKIVTE